MLSGFPFTDFTTSGYRLQLFYAADTIAYNEAILKSFQLFLNCKKAFDMFIAFLLLQC